jgi:hypothetical protein
VGQHPAVRDGDAGEQLPELLIIADRQQHVPRDDPVLLVVPRRVPRQLEDLKKEGEKRERHESGTHFSVAGWGNGGSDLGGEVLEDSGEVDGGAGADALGVAALLEVATDTADGELEAGLHGAGHRLLLRAAAATPGRASLLRHLRSDIHRRSTRALLLLLLRSLTPCCPSFSGCLFLAPCVLCASVFSVSSEDGSAAI